MSRLMDYVVITITITIAIGDSKGSCGSKSSDTDASCRMHGFYQETILPAECIECRDNCFHLTCRGWHDLPYIDDGTSTIEIGRMCISEILPSKKPPRKSGAAEFT